MLHVHCTSSTEITSAKDPNNDCISKVLQFDMYFDCFEIMNP